jgi:hypothetical protein
MQPLQDRLPAAGSRSEEDAGAGRIVACTPPAVAYPDEVEAEVEEERE